MLPHIKYTPDKKLPEANIQAILYNKLIERGINCILEHKYRNCKFDIAIIEKSPIGSVIVAIVEVKSKLGSDTPKVNGKQYKKYKALGLPLFYCCNLSQVDLTVQNVCEASEAFKSSTIDYNTLNDTRHPPIPDRSTYPL